MKKKDATDFDLFEQGGKCTQTGACFRRGKVNYDFENNHEEIYPIEYHLFHSLLVSIKN